MQMKTQFTAFRSLVLSSLLLGGLSACSGSSSDNDSEPPPPPPPPDETVGLDARPQNQSCLAPDSSTGADLDISLQEAFPFLPSLSQPLGMYQAPGDDSRWYVLEKGGRIRVFENTPGVSSFNDDDFLDLSSGFDINTSGEGGLLGMAFHPDFASNGRVYVSWTQLGSPMDSVITLFTLSNDGETLNPTTPTEIIRINQDFENHNGGTIAFGPDGLLYIGMGDGGSGGDPNNRAQDTTNLLGAMLRLNVNTVPYSIPSDNPFFGNSLCASNHANLQNCPEIYAWGLRNPWRWSFDTATGQIWAGDVGQGEREEIDIIEPNGNYGWNCREGSIAHPGNQAPGCASTSNFVEPVHDYPRTEGTSITGGYVYRGAAIPELTGHYIYGDFGSGAIWRLVPDGSGGWNDELLLNSGLTIASFAQDNDGELYVVDYGGGIYRIEESTSAPAPGQPVPDLLSDTGCVLPGDPEQPASGLIPYAPIAAFWSDGADKERWLALPDGSTITVDDSGDFDFPEGAVLMKHFRLNDTLVETRLLLHHNDGSWSGYSYEWESGGNDASLVTGGKVVNREGVDWIYPSSNECLVCHTQAAGVTLGLETAQLNHDFLYQLTGRSANQLVTMDHIALFSAPLGGISALPSLVDPTDTTASLEDRARAYLHTNCAQCHRPGGPTTGDMDLRFSTALNQTGTCDVPPQSGNLGLGTSARIIDPGNAGNSVLLARIQARDANAMPPLASSLVDEQGVDLMSDWINSLSTCM